MPDLFMEFLPKNADVPVMFWLTISSFIAAYVRSFSGFGFALLAVPLFLLALSPAQAIPLSLCFDTLVGLCLFPSTLRTGIDWKSVRTLFLASIPAIPLGLLFTKTVSLSFLQILVGMILLVSTALLASGFRTKTPPSFTTTLATGGASGFLGGMAGMFGPPIILFYMSGPLGKTVSRASMMTYFLVSLTFTLALQVGTAKTYSWALFLLPLLPVVLLGTYLGHKKFIATDEKIFRQAVYGLLFILAVSLIARAACV